ncbi:hypothetical protein J6R97_01350 [bacterium]|nr:hypothetical protein [bacterium]
MNNESVGKKIVEALKKQAESMDIEESNNFDLFEKSESSVLSETNLEINNDTFNEARQTKKQSFFDDVEEVSENIFADAIVPPSINEEQTEAFEMPANILVLKKLISQLPSGVSRHTGAQIIKQTMEALGISMKSVLQDAQQVQENLKTSARECQGTIQEYKKQILTLEKQSQNYQKQYSALNDLISLFIQTTR